MQTQLLDLLGVLFPNNLDSLLRRDVLILVAEFGFGAWRPERTFQLLALLQTSGHADAVHGAALLVLGPRAAGNVAAHNGFEGEDLETADRHAAVLELGAQSCGEGKGGGEVGAQEVSFERGDLAREEVEPVRCEKGEESALFWDALEEVSRLLWISRKKELGNGHSS